MSQFDRIRLAIAACASLAVTACSTIDIPTKKIDYKSAGKIPSLEVPPDLTRPTTDDRFLVPDVNPKGGATFSAYSKERAGPAAPGATRDVLPQGGDARIERAGTQRWLVVKGEPKGLWDVVKDFWQETGFIVNVEIPEAGVMETDWAENRAKIPDGAIRNILGKFLDQVYSTSERDKFRTRLERGGETGTTEIFISHRGMEEVYKSEIVDNRDTRWQPRPPNPELEAEMLRRLMVRLGVQESRVKAQLASGSVAPRASLSRTSDGATLALDEQFDRAWRRVGLALDRVGFTVEDRDRSKGLYFVRYIDPEIDNKSADKGWLSRFKFWGDGSKPKNEQYQILVRSGDSGAEINVLDKSGARENSQTAGRILTLLYEQLK